MAIVLLALAAWLLLGEPAHPRRLRGRLTHRELTDRYGTTYQYDVPLRRGIAYSSVVGFVSSFLGIGGGIIHVPLLVRALAFPTHLATATSHFVLAIIAGSARPHTSFQEASRTDTASVGHSLSPSASWPALNSALACHFEQADVPSRRCSESP
jgi:uncharacterized membrane protein YfcA